MSKICFLFLSLMFLISCSKDVELKPEKDDIVSFRSGRNGDNEFLSKDENTKTKVTILGSIRANPYSVLSMTTAYNTLYGTSVSSLPATHYYIKFLPVNQEQVLKLINCGIKLYEYDVRREVIEMGEYYVDPNWPVDYIPPFYSVIKVGCDIPDIAHEVVEKLYLYSNDENLIRKSLELKGFDPDVEGYIVGDASTPYDCTTNDPNNPPSGSGGNGTPSGSGGNGPYYCECVEYEYGNEVRRWVVESEDGDCSEYENGSVTWSIECNSYTPPPPPNNFTTNGCGCTVFSDERKPGGCIKVRDTNHGQLEGVKRVKVILKDTWFTEDEVWTDDNGCFRINSRYSGSAWMWVKYESSRIKIRGTKGGFASIWQWAFPVKDYVGRLKGPRFNNISVNYEMWSEQGGTAHLYWGAATVNNANHDFHEYAATDGINGPKTQLDVYVGKGDRYGYALMSGQNFFAQTTGVILAAVTWWAGPFQPLIALLGWAGVQAYLPDVHVGINFTSSSVVKGLAYHEFAHASHYTKAGDYFWGALVAGETLANGHGSSTSNNAGIISLCESWAEHIGMTYEARKYGGNTLQELEETRNESANHIPIGVYLDLIDNINDVVPACDRLGGGCGVINDAASSFTNAQMFSVLDGATTSPAIFRSRLTAGSTPTVVTQVNNLFSSY